MTGFYPFGERLHYAVNRYYQSSLGRFVTPDPYVASGGAGELNTTKCFHALTRLANSLIVCFAAILH